MDICWTVSHKMNQVKYEGHRPKHGLLNLLDSIRHINWSHDCTFKSVWIIHFAGYYPMHMDICWTASNTCTCRVKYGLSDVAIIGHAPVDNMQSDTFI